MPFQAAMRVAKPSSQPASGMTRHGLLAELRVIRRSAMKAARMRKMPSPRAKTTRERLPLQMVQRMKFGCACLRSEYSTVVMTERKADGWVVFWRA